jgi:hypothetical protein
MHIANFTIILTIKIQMLRNRYVFYPYPSNGDFGRVFSSRTQKLLPIIKFRKTTILLLMILEN